MKGQPWSGGHPEMLLGCSHGEEAPRDQPWHWQCCKQPQQVLVFGKRAESWEGAGGDAQQGELALGWVMPLSLQALGTS